MADADDDYYNQMLDRHLRHGHLPKAQVQRQRMQMAKDKAWQTSFHEQVRGVASTMQTPKNVIELDNPAIEISVK
jgi:hypothetical protein